jgi:hypothetical protein
MPADLVPQTAIPDLAARVDSSMYWVLLYLKRAGFIRRGVDDRLVEVLRRLTGLGLVDPGYDGSVPGEPYLWTGNGNGGRVLKHIEITPVLQDAVAPRFSIHARARTALASIPDRDRLQTLLAVDALVTRDPGSWPKAEAVALGAEKQVYLVRVTPELRAFIRVLDPQRIELFDLVREDTLQQFLEHQGARSTVG